MMEEMTTRFWTCLPQAFLNCELLWVHQKRTKLVVDSSRKSMEDMTDLYENSGFHMRCENDEGDYNKIMAVSSTGFLEL
ncbi:hypothetical protein COCNU_09G006460 [Cocos nucifera]|uniref:Uncharacterized protein n=1 Tax=Cocos nucifera TaxID=13894 RepID=A0A8K0IJP6_COCNU|nr:hypothetical protein COCNU_09G006460 [Cocos nucifera]